MRTKSLLLFLAKHRAAWAHSTKEVKGRSGAFALALAAVIGLSVVAPPTARAQTFTSLYSLMGGTNDGGQPYSALIDVNGTLYGTASGNGAHGYGAVFKITSAGKEMLLYSFKGSPNDGADPYIFNWVTDSQGNLYGITAFGGAGTCTDNTFVGCGTIFKITSAGKESILYSFKGGAADGFAPDGGLVMDSGGNIYGETNAGGTLVSGCNSGAGCGVIFKITSAGAEEVLYKFCKKTNCADGAEPQGTMAIDASGNLYGTTLGGGTNGGGTVFKVTPSGTESVLYNFCSETNCTDGEIPYSGVVLDKRGNLYGTTGVGGKGICGQGTCGTIFTVSTSSKKFNVLHSFTGPPNDGFLPFGGLAINAAGTLYGTTMGGGSDTAYGTVFILTGSSESLLHSFDATDGQSPEGGLIVNSRGAVYGTTYFGGSGTACLGQAGCGTIFEVVP